MPNIKPTLTPAGAINEVRYVCDTDVASVIAAPFTATLTCGSMPTILNVFINAVNGTDWSLQVVDPVSTNPCKLTNTHTFKTGTTITGTTDGGFGSNLNLMVELPMAAPGA